ncbi:MAG: glycoside hydrolase family 127 protein [Eubacteriales bacterium]|nr:glycoside hydrolase family 127 protein [Eubacteriales bacterium]
MTIKMKIKTKQISYKDVDIDEGFWSNKLDMISGTSIRAIRDSFKQTGRFGAFRQDWKEGEPNKPHIFWDSDVAKWIEATAYILAKKRDAELEAEVDELVDLIEKHQDPDGYFNIYFILIEPDARWTRRGAHELYTAGHLMEAAVAYCEATGKDKFLRLMCRFADHIEKVFVKDHSAAFSSPGHEEIELALVRLYRFTGEKRYLELSKYFIDARGTVDPGQSATPPLDLSHWRKSRNIQDHAPVRSQRTAEGHAVRAAYLYSGMADIAYEYDDTELFEACRAIYENITRRRMYITGGIGSTAIHESFTVDYDLPGLTAYTETCAAIAAAFFVERMTCADNENPEYADIFERLIYNGILSGISLDGKTFFYENPLEVQPYLVERNNNLFEGQDLLRARLPKPERSEVFNCSCCPPNIARFVASIGSRIFTYSNETLYINQYIASTTRTNVNGSGAEIKIMTEYPANGRVSISVSGSGFSKIAVRIPSWCRSYTFSLTGSSRFPAAGRQENASAKYIYFENTASASPIYIDIEFEMKVLLKESSPFVQDNAGRAAVQYGPVVYCLEEPDNGRLLRNISISCDNKWEIIPNGYFGANILKTTGYTKSLPKDLSGSDSLYYDACGAIDVSDTRGGSPVLEQKPLTFIPYYAFANRGIAEMTVWVLRHFHS